MASNLENKIIKEIGIKLTPDQASLGELKKIFNELQLYAEKVKPGDIEHIRAISNLLAQWKKQLDLIKGGFDSAANSHKLIAEEAQKTADAMSKEDAIEKKILLTAKEKYKIKERLNRLAMERLKHESSIARQNELQRQRTKLVGQNSEKAISDTMKIDSNLNSINKNTKNFSEHFKTAFANAFSLEKLLNRMAFVITAKLSYELFNIAQKAMKDLVTNAVDFEAEMSKVFTLLEENEGAFEKILSKEVMVSMLQYGQSLETSARAVYDILSARFDPAQVGIILDESLKLAVGEFTDLKIATDAVTTVLNSFSLSADHAGEAASFIAQMVTDGKTTLEELYTNLGKITSVAASLGFDMKQLGAAFSTVTLQGIKTDVAITSLRQLMMRLIDPSAEASKIIKDYGLQLDIASIQAGGFSKVLEEMNGLSEDQLLAFAKSRTGAQALFALMNSGEKFQESYNNQLENTSAHLEKYEKRMKDVRLEKDKLNELVKVLSIKIGEDLLPVFTVLIKNTGDFTKGLYLIGTIIKNSIPFIIGMTGAVSIMAWRFGLLAVSISAAKGALAGPAGVVIAVAATTAAIIGAGSTLKDFDKTLDDTGDTFTSVTGIIDGYKKSIEEASEVVRLAEIERLQLAIAALYSRKIGKTDEEKKFLDLQIKSLEDQLKIVSTLHEYAISDAGIRVQNIKDANELYEQSKLSLEKSQQELDNLYSVKEALDAQIQAKKDNIVNDDKVIQQRLIEAAIADDLVEKYKLEEKIRLKIISNSKDAVDLESARYAISKQSKNDFDVLLNAHESYITTLQNQSASEKDIAQAKATKYNLEETYRIKEINDRYKILELDAKITKDNIDDLVVTRDKNKELTKDIEEQKKIEIYYNRLIADENLKLAKQKLDLIKSEYDLTIAGSKDHNVTLDQLISSHKTYKNLLTDENEIAKEQLIIQNLINSKVIQTTEASYDEFIKMQDTIYKMANSGDIGKISAYIKNLGEDTNLSKEQMDILYEILLKIIDIAEAEVKTYTWQDYASGVMDIIHNMVDSINAIYDTISTNRQLQLDNDLRKLQEQQDAEIANAEATGAKTSEINRRYAKLKRDETEKARQDELKFKRAMQPLQVAVATGDAFVAFNSALKQDLPPVVREIYAGSVLALGLAKAASIAAIKYSGGGLIEGPSHSSGGVPFSIGGRVGFEAEGGEYVVNKKSTAMYLPLLQAINNMQPISAPAVINKTYQYGGIVQESKVDFTSINSRLDRLENMEFKLIVSGRQAGTLVNAGAKHNKKTRPQ